MNQYTIPEAIQERFDELQKQVEKLSKQSEIDRQETLRWQAAS